MDLVVSDVPEGGVDGGELEREAVLRELTIRLVGGGVFHTVTTWSVDAWEVSSMPNSSEFFGKTEGQERKQRWRRARKLRWITCWR